MPYTFENEELLRMARDRRLHRVIAAVLAVLITFGAGGFVEPAAPALGAASSCGTPGKDGSVTYNSGVPNTYYAGSGNLAVGATTVTLGAMNASGSTTAFTVGDLALIIQMQGAAITSTNSAAYGTITSTPIAGTYEYVAVRGVSGSTLTIVSKNGGGLVNAYTEAAATSAQGAQTYQVIRVPQYKSFTFTAGDNLYTAPWNGSSGGVIALDVTGTLTLASSINADGYGFRGGGQLVWGNGSTNYNPAPAASAEGYDGAYNNDYVYNFSDGTYVGGQSYTAVYADTGNGNQGGYYLGGPDGFKGEGIAGTPAYVYGSGNAYSQLSGSSDTGSASVSAQRTDSGYYPGGSKGRGAPANAGGGATDADADGSPYQPNQYNSGGGGGANGGAGGMGGQNWSGTASTTTAGSTNSQGIGGAAFQPTYGSLQKVIMGGGGGAGSNNDGSAGTKSINVGGGKTMTPTSTTASSGGQGGGIVMLRAGTITGSSTISAQGISAPDPDNDGGGGGGAGGTVVVTATNAFTGIAINVSGGKGASATGGDGGTSQYDNPTSTTPYYPHGPGGGGGGGVVYYGSKTGTSSITLTDAGGGNGTTTGSSIAYGATSGGTGVATSTNVTPANVPGARSGAECELLLVAKRFTSINGTAQTGYAADGFTDTTSGEVIDSNPYWPQSGGNPAIPGLTTIAAGSKPADKIEFTIYYLSAGGSGVTAGAICDFVPPDMTLVNAYNSNASPMEVISGYASPATTYYGTVTTGSGVYTVSTSTGTGAPSGCGTAPKNASGKYSSAAIYYNPGTIAPFATTDSGYGQIKFTGQVN